MPQPATSTGGPAARPRTVKLIGLALVLLSMGMALPAGASALSSTGAIWSPRSTWTTDGLYAVASTDATHG